MEAEAVAVVKELTSEKCPLKFVKAVPYGFQITDAYIKKPWPVFAWREWYYLEKPAGAKP